jgi:uncharacterized membrane protein YfcA
MYFIFIAVSILASAFGSICGIGGGIIIKPVLDTFGLVSVASASFLSGFTVFSMSLYCVVISKLGGQSLINVRTSGPMSAGAVIGGLTGKYIFQMIWESSGSSVEMIQSICLAALTCAALIYTIKKDGIQTLRIKSRVFSGLIGIILGFFSAFLGIGGGPLNIVALYYFFSMETKEAAENSLYIILFSQAASLLNTVVSNTIPEMDTLLLLLMMMGGVGGSIIGKKINKKISAKTVQRLFIGLMSVIILMSIRNILQFI